MKTALVLGAGGFIGSHLVNRLKSEGYWVRGVDLKHPEYSPSQADEMLIYDLRKPDNVEAVMRLEFADVEHTTPYMFTYLHKPFTVLKPFDEVYQLAADMGGCQYVFSGDYDADIMHNSAMINLNVCEWASKYKVSKVFYSSSACMYPQEKQSNVHLAIQKTWSVDSVNKIFALSESDAYPANPDSEYGWEKLFSERLYLAYARNYNLDVRIARFHNIYGPEGTYQGGREKAPASISRKVIECADNGMMPYPENRYVEMWGDGLQTRSFLYIDDCIDAVRLLMQSDFKEPINIGSEEMVTIKELWELAINISGKDLELKSKPFPNSYKGVQGRNSNNDLIRKVLNWEPKYTLRQGMELTFKWIASNYGL